MPFHDSTDNVKNTRKGNFFTQKRIDSDFIGPVEDTGHGPADAARFIGQADGRELLVIRREKFQRPQGLPVDGPGAADGHPVRISKGVLDGQAHVGQAQLAGWSRR